MRNINTTVKNYSGQLLLAHPLLIDPNFCRSVVLLSMHSDEEGALGVIINRPLGKKLSDFDKSQAGLPYADMPVFEGGPVATEQIIITAWQWLPEGNGFKLYFGITLEKVGELMEIDPFTQVCCFMGHAGWTSGQLETEMKQPSWVVTPVVSAECIEGDLKTNLWKKNIKKVDFEYQFLVDTPDDPAVN